MRHCLAVLPLAAISYGAPVTLPLFFEENRGQSVEQVRFLSSGSNTIFFTENAAVIAFASGDVVRIRPERAMKSQPEPLESLPGKTNYLSRDTPIVGVRHYARIRYRSVYPGIDIVYHGGSELEYDFNIAAGAHPERIRLSLQGAEELRVDDEGNLRARMQTFTFIQRKPQAWQSDGGARRPVDVRYLVTRQREVAFAIGAYDRTRPLTIDPLIDYITDVGATATDAFQLGTVPYAIAADSAGNAYITGDAISGPFPSGQRPAPPSHATGFVAKLSPDGTQLLYATYLNQPAGQAIVLDSQGNVCIGGTDYIARLAPDGSAITFTDSFPTLLGATVNQLIFDAAGNLYALGNTSAANFPTTPGAYQATFPGQIGFLGNPAYGFVRKLSPSGSVVYSTYLRDELLSAGSPGTQYATQVFAVDPVAQNTMVLTVTTPSVTGQNSNSLLKLGPTGMLVSSAPLSQTPLFTPSLATDSAGNLYLAGNGPGFGALTTIGPNFLIEFDPSGAVVASKTLPFEQNVHLDATGNEYVLHLDASGNAYIVSGVRSGNGNTIQETPSVTRVAKGFTAITTNPLATASISDQVQSSAVDQAGNVYVVLTPGAVIGQPPQIPTTPGAYQTTGGGFAVLKADAGALGGPPAPPTPPSISALENAASGLLGVLAPGEILTFYGSNLGPTQLVSAIVGANGLLPTTLAGVSVLIGGEPIPLLYVSATQVAGIAPMSVSGAPTVQISYQGALSPANPAAVTPAFPGLFTADASGHGQGAILNQDGSVNSVSHAAALGSVISLFCSGCGATNPPGTDGAIAASLAPLTNPCVVTIGNQLAQVLYAGAAPGLVNGAIQINATIPSGVSGDAVLVSISIGNLPPSPSVTVAVH